MVKELWFIFFVFIFIYLYVYKDIDVDGIVFWYLGINLFGIDVFLRDIMLMFFVEK